MMRRVPAEWERQEAIWLSWPTPAQHWRDLGEDVLQSKWAEICTTIAEYQQVRLNAPAQLHGAIQKVLQGANMDHITLYDHANNDVWCRDHGAIFIEEEGAIVATDWQFNGWGENFGPWELDNQIAGMMGRVCGLPVQSYSEVLEGGAVEVNGAGTLLTTEAVLLNENRNPHLDHVGVEAMLAERLGIQRVVWLNKGIEGDDTGGHIDDIARFVSADQVLIASATEGGNQQILDENYQRLVSAGGLEVTRLPMPRACEVPGWRLPILPASYANFLITNEQVLVPTFRQSMNDGFALELIQHYFPTRQVIGIDSLDIVREGGALHCISMQQPAS